MNTLGPFHGLPPNYDANNVSLAEHNISQRHTDTNLPQNATNFAPSQNAFEPSPPPPKPITTEFLGIRNNLLGDPRGASNSLGTLWNSDFGVDVQLNTVQSGLGDNLEQFVHLPRMWETRSNERRAMIMRSKAKEAKWEYNMELSINSGESTCSTLPTEPSSPLSQPVSIQASANTLRRESKSRYSNHRTAPEFARYSSSVPEPSKVPIPISRSSRTNTQPLPAMYVCESCSKGFTLRKDRDRHVANKHRGPQFLCPVPSCIFASRGFPRKDKAIRHIKTRHSEYPGIEPQKIPEDGLFQDAQSEKSSQIYAYSSPGRSVTASSHASLQDEGNALEGNSYESSLSAFNPPPKGFGHLFVEADNNSMENFNYNQYFNFQSEDLYTDLDKIALQLNQETDQDCLSQDSHIKVLDDSNDADFIESNSGDRVTFPAEVEISQSDSTDDSKPKGPSFHARHHHTF